MRRWASLPIPATTRPARSLWSRAKRQNQGARTEPLRTSPTRVAAYTARRCTVRSIRALRLSMSAPTFGGWRPCAGLAWPNASPTAPGRSPRTSSTKRAPMRSAIGCGSRRAWSSCRASAWTRWARRRARPGSIASLWRRGQSRCAKVVSGGKRKTPSHAGAAG